MNVKKILMFICFLVLFFLVASQTRVVQFLSSSSAWERPGVKTGMERAESWTSKPVKDPKGYGDRFEGKSPPMEGGLQPTGPKPLPSDELEVDEPSLEAPASEPQQLKPPLKKIEN